MSEPTDHELLADYARTASETAFARLVARYINLVHSAARRHAGNEAQAGEITQAVFLILARKAGSLSKGGPRRHVALGGWLYQTARLTAANAQKAETRRQLRDHQAYMESQENQADAAVWREIAPLLDDAMGKLGETDRTVLVLRFFEGRTNAETAAALGLAEGAVQKRVQRALEKLRAAFAKQGVTHTAQAIAGSVNRYAVLAAPAGLMALICANAAQGAIIATSITALANGTLQTLAMTTIQKTLITATLIASVGTGLYEAKENAQARAEVRTLQQQQAPLAEQIRQLQIDYAAATNRLAGSVEDLAKINSNNRELLKLRGEIAPLKQANEILAANAKNADELQARLGNIISNTPPIKTFTASMTTTANWNEGIVTGGWKIPSGKRAIIIVTSTHGNKAQEINIKSRVWECSEETAQKMGLDQIYAIGRNQPHSLKLNSEQLRTVFNMAVNSGEIEAIAEPEVQTTSGRQAQIQSITEHQTASGEKYSIGPILDFVPTISADGQSFQLIMTANINYPIKL